MKRLLLLCLAFLGIQTLAAQAVFLDSTYAVRQETLFYAAPVNYRGCVDSLFMTRYIPVNTRTDRPIVVLIHGGGFVAGTRHDATTNRLGLQLAARGYHTATIDYRLGYHIPANINASFGCLIFNAITNYSLDACQYPADTAEVIRALYRGSQDAKTALRFLKSRYVQDSTDRTRTFMIGESAGAFLTLQAAFMDSESEKPAQTGSLANAPTPGFFQCTWNNPCAGNDLTRPDLGSVRGTGNLQETDQLTGIISLLGGMPKPEIIATNAYYPRLYLHHQSCDPIVPYRRDRVYAGLSRCMNDWAPGCANCPAIGPVPFVSGGKGIHEYIQANMTYQGLLQADFVERGNPINQYYGCLPDVTCGSLNPCPYCLNSTLYDCHTTYLNATRMDSISKFLYDAVVAIPERLGPDFSISPNPGEGRYELQLGVGVGEVVVRVIDLQGRQIHMQELHARKSTIDLGGAASGVYLIRVEDKQGNSTVEKLIIR